MIVAVDDAPDVVAIIPTLGRRPERLAECIAAVRAQRGDSRVAVLVVLNTPEPVPAPPGVDVLRPGLNLGWSGALVHARARISAPYLWLVQDDMRAEPDALAALRVALDADPGLGVVAPVVVDEDGTVRPGSCGGILRSTGDPDRFGMERWLPEIPTRPADLTGLDRLDYVPSRGMLLRTGDWDRIGGMDSEYYPVQWADVDLCARLRSAGLGFAVVADARVAHSGRGSTGSALGDFLFERHRRRFHARWVAREQDAPPAITVDAELLGPVARAASTALLDLAADGESNRRLRDEVDALHRELESMRRSTSWRISAPVRTLGRIVRGRGRGRGRAAQAPATNARPSDETGAASGR